MNWLSNLTPPGIKNMFKRQEEGETLWVKCGGCGDMIYERDVVANQHVCPSCGFHMSIAVEERLAALFDEGAYDLLELPEPPADPLKFRDERRYADRLRDARRKTGQQAAMCVASGALDGMALVAAVQNFKFMGGSMGVALGEALIAAADAAIEARAPLVAFTASGGARMQEGILSLMQMPRTTIAVQTMREAGLPFVVVLTHPTTGGVTASFAMLGDVHIAEPGALIGFAGPRVIEQTIREKLPDGFQRSEFLMDKGMVDMVVHRHEMRAALSKLLRVLAKGGVAAAAPTRKAGDADEATPAPANDAKAPQADERPSTSKKKGRRAGDKGKTPPSGAPEGDALDKAAE
ncbi:MAG: acetyl-CoA carboxylase, carboxyltransferase subunit beta [Parvularculaceae bacterium]